MFFSTWIDFINTGIWVPWRMKHSKEFEKCGEKENKD